jgi:hypothetical protein
MIVLFYATLQEVVQHLFMQCAAVNIIWSNVLLGWSLASHAQYQFNPETERLVDAG